MTVPFLFRTTTQVQSFALALLPHGGQGAARRNAWSAMAADLTHARSRHEAELAVHHAALRAQRQARATS